TGQWNTPKDKVALQCGQDAKSPEKETKKAAVTHLATMTRIDAVAPQVASGLQDPAADPDWTLAIEAVKALDVWGGKDNTPALARLAEANVNVSHHYQLWKTIIGVLAKWKDDRSVPAVALGLGNVRSPAHRSESARALIAMGGPVVKKEVEEKYLNS